MNYNLRQASKLTQTKVSQDRHFRQNKKNALHLIRPAKKKKLSF